jgi:hypothetical protein
MSKLTSTNLLLKKIKRDAHRLSKETSIPKHLALKQVAICAGFDSWFSYKNHIENSRLQPEADLKKLFAHEVDDDSLPENIIGLTQHENDLCELKLKTSIFSLTNEHFKTSTEIRNRLEDKIKNLISDSKHLYSFNLTVFINQETSDLINDKEAFYGSIVDRYDRLYVLYVTVTDQGLSIQSAQNILNDIIEASAKGDQS